MPSVVAVHNGGVAPCRGEVLGGMLEAMVRIVHSQPNEARRALPLAEMDPFHSAQAAESRARFFELGLKLLAKGKIGLKKKLVRLFHKPGSSPPPPVTAQPQNSIILRSAQQRFVIDAPCIVASFEVNSEPYTGARPSVRLRYHSRRSLELMRFYWFS
jgi:hypothetical protein